MRRGVFGTMGRVLVVRNHPQEGSGLIGERLRAAGIDLLDLAPISGDRLPERIDGLDGALVLGGPQSAMDDARHPYFGRIVDLLRVFAAADRPVLGICLGAQLMARAHAGPANAAPVRENDVVEIGFDVEVEFLPDARHDPLFAHAPARLPLMQWHHDVFDLPPGGVRLATSANTHVQAFRLGRTQYGVQFHPEVTRADVLHWIETHEGDVDRDYPGLRDRIGAELDRHIVAANGFARTLGDRFAALVRAAVVATA